MKSDLSNDGSDMKTPLDSVSNEAIALDTEKANAVRLTQHHKDELRFVAGEGWYRYNGKWWDNSTLAASRIASGVDHYIKQEATEIYQDARDTRDEATRRRLQERADTLMKWARTSERHAVIRNSLALAQTMLELPAYELDADPFLLNLQNGTFELNSGTLRPHDPKDFMTHGAPVAYDPDATAPGWQAFLEKAVPDDALRTYLQKAVGYSLSGSVEEQVLFMLYGKGSNGKSTFLSLITCLLGPGYAKLSAPDLFTSSNLDRHPTELADLKGARFVYVPEVDRNKRFASDRVKLLTGETTIKARGLYKEFSEFAMTAKLWLAFNDKPHVSDTSHGFWRRIRFIPFTTTFEKEQRDNQFLNKLTAELPGILNWALEGYRLYREEGLEDTPEMNEGLTTYRLEMDTVGRFIEEACETGDPLKVKTPAGELYPYYLTWCGEVDVTPVSNTEFKRQVQEKGYLQRKNDGSMFYKGIMPIVKSNSSIVQLEEAA